MYLVISLRLFRLLYARLQAGRRTLYLLTTAGLILSLVTTVRMMLNHMIKQSLTMIVASRRASELRNSRIHEPHGRSECPDHILQHA